tara:strand:- start:2829 stop:3545 length:717 start_codon:yes stop_codon:yes gene_type:complete
MEKVSIELWGYTLLEPSTYVSDVLLAVFSLGLFMSLKRMFPSSKFQMYYGYFFFFMALSTLTGGHAHLLANYFDHYLFHSLSWAFSALAIYNMQMGSAFDYPEKVKKILSPVFLVQLIISVLIYFGYQLFGDVTVTHDTVGTPGFLAVKISLGIAFIGFILPLHVYKIMKEKDHGSAIFLMGIVSSVAALIIQSKKWGVNQYINYNVVAHLVLAICYYLYYLGVRQKIAKYEGLTEKA